MLALGEPENRLVPNAGRDENAAVAPGMEGRPPLAPGSALMSHRPLVKKWVPALAKLALVGLLAWFLRGTLSKTMADLREHELHVQWQWLVVAGIAYLAASLPNAIFSAQVIAATDHPVSWFTALRAYYVSAIGKYVPGKAMVLVLRAAIMRETMVPVTVITVGVFYETLTNMAVGSAVALLNLLNRLSDPQMQLFAAGALVALLATGLPTLPPSSGSVCASPATTTGWWTLTRSYRRA